jgi:hypothetical protein
MGQRGQIIIMVGKIQVGGWRAQRAMTAEEWMAPILVVEESTKSDLWW